MSSTQHGSVQIAAGTWYDPGTNTRRKATQYFEVVSYHCGRYASREPTDPVSVTSCSTVS